MSVYIYNFSLVNILQSVLLSGSVNIGPIPFKFTHFTIHVSYISGYSTYTEIGLFRQNWSPIYHTYKHLKVYFCILCNYTSIWLYLCSVFCFFVSNPCYSITVKLGLYRERCSDSIAKSGAV